MRHTYISKCKCQNLAKIIRVKLGKRNSTRIFFQRWGAFGMHVILTVKMVGFAICIKQEF